jgi:tetratricopeptide (TPR) repeat protein
VVGPYLKIQSIQDTQLFKMSGSATFSGTAYQAGVIAYVYAHLLAAMRLGWLTYRNDRPFAISGEVGGPGDDASVEFQDGGPPIEIQAKHGFTAGAQLRELISRLSQGGSITHVVLAVNRASTRSLYATLASDLERLRAGRGDAITSEGRRLFDTLTDAERQAAERLHIIPVDVDAVGDPDAKSAIVLLSSVLDRPEQSEAAWKILRDDAANMCAQRSRRTRPQLAALLKASGISVGPPSALSRFKAQLDISKLLLKSHKPQAALAALAEVERDFPTDPVDPDLGYRFHQQKGAAHLQLGANAEALRESLVAVDLRPTGVEALIVAALASMSLDDGESAIRLANRATQADPQSAYAWVAKEHVAAVAGESVPVVPPDVAASVEYRTGRVQLLLNMARATEALGLTTDLLAEGIRTPEILALRTQALLLTDHHAMAVFDPQVAREIERLATEVIDADTPDDIRRTAFLSRALALRSLGRTMQADADIRAASAIQPDDPRVILEAAQLSLIDGDAEKALAVLSSASTERHPFLLALRAHAFAMRNRGIEARRDIERVLATLSHTDSSDETRCEAADAAILIRDDTLAVECLRAVSPQGRETSRYAVSLGRLAFLREDAEAAQMHFEQAAARDVKLAPGCFAELGSTLQARGLSAEAVKAFDRASPLPSAATPSFVRALVASRQLVRANDILATYLAGPHPPEWAIECAVNLALAREDLETAATLLENVAGHPTATPLVKLELVRLLVALRRLSAATPLLEEVDSGRVSLTPREGMVLAHLFEALGDIPTALARGFEAYRRDDSDPELHRGLATLALRSRNPPEQPLSIGADTHFVMVNERDGTRRDHTVYSSPPINKRANELLLADAEGIGVVGRAVGDIIVFHPGTWLEERWRITELQSAIRHTVQDILAHYQERFPSEPFFVAGFSIGNEPTVSSFAPIIESLAEKRKLIDQVFSVYAEKILPLGAVAEMTGSTITDVMTNLAGAEAGHAIQAEWSDNEGVQASVNAVMSGNAVVLTESALFTASELGLLDSLHRRLRIIAPRSLRELLRDRLDEAERLVTDGSKTVSSGGPGLRLDEFPPGDQRLVQARDRAAALLQWVIAYCIVEPRPLTLLMPHDGDRPRELIGESSFDAMELAIASRLPLYADDLGLRRVLHASAAEASSFSTIALLMSVPDGGAVSKAEAQSHLLRLAEMRYATVPMTADLLVAATKHGVVPLQKALGCLCPPGTSLQRAVKIGAAFLREFEASDVQTLTLPSSTHMLLDALGTHWPKPVVAYTLLAASRESLRLLPRALLTVARICRHFAGDSTSRGME